MNELTRIIDEIDGNKGEELDDVRDLYNEIIGLQNIHSVDYDNGKLVITTQPITLVNRKNPKQTLELGRLKIHLGAFKSINITRDTSSSRSDQLSISEVHPHVGSGGGICYGNISTTVNNLQRQGDIPMLITYLCEFFKTYNAPGAFWKPMFAQPCDCIDKSQCIFCACYRCAKRKNNRCPGCEYKALKTSQATVDTMKKILDSVMLAEDDDDFIELSKDLIKVIETKVGREINV